MTTLRKAVVALAASRRAITRRTAAGDVWEGLSGARGIQVLVAALLAAGLWSSVAIAAPKLVISETKTKGNQKIEVKNEGDMSAELSDYGVRNAAGDEIIFDPGTLDPGAVVVIDVPDDFMNSAGDCIELFDSSLRATVDRVDYGDAGGAPLDILSVPASTIARTDFTPDPTGANSATRWTIDLTGTLGSANDAPSPNLGSSAIINEIRPGNPVEIEIWSSSPINLGGWFLSTGTTLLNLTGSGAGFFVFSIPDSGFTLSLNAYLVDDLAVRVDQLGLSDSHGNQSTYNAVLAAGDSFQRIPDGDGPNTGYDLPSSGYPFTLRSCDPTVGAPNQCQGGPGSSAPAISPASGVVAVIVLLGVASWALRRRRPEAVRS